MNHTDSKDSDSASTAQAGHGAALRDPPLSRLFNIAHGALLSALVGVACGGASALLLELLERATQLRETHSALIFALPVAGLAIGWLYERYGQPVQAGTNLVLDTYHTHGAELPLRMGPMVLLGTVLTHLFGGSAGREGTAVQMGASLADWLAHRLQANPLLRRQLLCAGAAGGFGSVFGTPVAGALFSLEYLVLGRVKYDALVPALVAALVGDMTVRALGVGHTVFAAAPQLLLTPLLFAKWLVFAAAMAAAARCFMALTQFIKQKGQHYVPRLPLRMGLGGLLLVGLWQVVGSQQYLGLGVPTIEKAFVDPHLVWYTFAFKLLFTAVTLGAGFIGGEVTPLFFVGATLGSVLARYLGIPIELGAGVGLAAVFAACSNAPLALSVMALELLGAQVFPHVVIVCVVAYLLAGHRGIYGAQRLASGKGGAKLTHPTQLRHLMATRGDKR